MNEILQKFHINISIMQLTQLFFAFKEKLTNVLRMKLLSFFNVKDKNKRKITITKLNKKEQKIINVETININLIVFLFIKFIILKNNLFDTIFTFMSFERLMTINVLITKIAFFNDNFYIKTIIELVDDIQNLFRIRVIFINENVIVCLLFERIITKIKKLNKFVNFEIRMKIANEIWISLLFAI